MREREGEEKAKNERKGKIVEKKLEKNKGEKKKKSHEW